MSLMGYIRMIGSTIIGNIKNKFREEMKERKADKEAIKMAKMKARKVYRETKATETVKIAKVKAKSDAKKGGILKRISTSIAENKKSSKKEDRNFFKGSAFTVGNDSGKKQEKKARNVFEL